MSDKPFGKLKRNQIQVPFFSLTWGKTLYFSFLHSDFIVPNTHKEKSLFPDQELLIAVCSIKKIKKYTKTQHKPNQKKPEVKPGK